MQNKSTHKINYQHLTEDLGAQLTKIKSTAALAAVIGLVSFTSSAVLAQTASAPPSAVSTAQSQKAPEAQSQSATQSEKSLYDRLGGVFAVAAVVDHFSDAVVKNPVVGKKSKNMALRQWHTKNLKRLPGLKFMRTLWVSTVAGGPFNYAPTRPGRTDLGLEEAHRNLKISPAEFDEVAAELGRTLDVFKIAKREKEEVIAAFAAHKKEVTEGYGEKMATK